MPTIQARVRTIEGTEAARGSSGGHDLVVDRPDGLAGGTGSGFNGGQLLALALAGCLANDLRYVAHETDVALTDVDVAVELDVDDGRVGGARVVLRAKTPDGPSPELVRRAQEVSTVLAAVRDGFVVEVTA